MAHTLMRWSPKKAKTRPSAPTQLWELIEDLETVKVESATFDEFDELCMAQTGNFTIMRDFVNSLKRLNGNTQLKTMMPDIERQLATFMKNDLYIQRTAECLLKKYKDIANTCKEKDSETKRLEGELKRVKGELSMVKGAKFDELHSLVQKINLPKPAAPKPGMSTSPSYAQAVSKPANKPVTTSHVVVIEPKDDDILIADSATTFQLIKKTVNHNLLKDEKIAIKGKKLTSKKRVVVTCGSAKQCEALCKAMESDRFLKASIPRKRDPLVKIWGIDESVPKEEVFGMLLSQNTGFEKLGDAKFRPKFEKVDQNGTKFVIAEVEPRLYAKLMALKRICLGYSMCSVRGHIGALRCYKCNRFGHTQSVCRNEAACAKCAGHHDTRDCTQEAVKCTNCDWVNSKRTQRNEEPIDTDHRADDPRCAQHQRMLRVAECRYDFG